MLSISPPAKGAARAKYYLDLAREDYYLAGGEPLGKWGGEGSKYIGLNGKTVERSQFQSLIQGYAPKTGLTLVQNAGKERQALWDLTFSAPKSVSVAWSQGSEQLRREIQLAQEDAVKAALEQVEELYGWTRRGKGGENLERAHLIYALFEHGTSRAQDPQLHTHALLFNLGVRDDGSTGSILSKPFFVAKMTIGALYRAELARLCEQRLGFSVEQGPQNTFELKGRHTGLCSFFSKRSRAVREEMAKSGEIGAIAAQRATLRTRDTKEHVPRRNLFGIWQKIGHEWGWTQKEVERSRSHHKERDIKREGELAVAYAIEKLMHNNTHFTENALIRTVAEVAQTQGIGAKEVVKICRQALASDQLKAVGDGVFTTKKCLDMEAQLLATIEKSRPDKRHAISRAAVDRKLRWKRGLSDEQKNAIRHITTQQGRISVLCGMAGTGKSTLLKVARQIWEKKGFTVYGAAFTGKAACELQDGSGIESRTICKTQMLLDRKGRRYWGKKTIFRKAPRWNPLSKREIPWLYDGKKEKLILTKKSVLVIDEAGMVPTPQLKALLESADAVGAKVVLVGDPKQLQAIGQGGAFASIAQRLGSATLTEIKRQTQDWGKELVRNFAGGEAAQALAKMQELGLLKLASTKESAISKLIQDWQKHGVEDPHENLILAGTRAEAAKLNEMAQEARIKGKKLGSASVKNGEERIYEGDRVLFTKNSRYFGVQNGTLATVTDIDRHRLTAKLDNGKVVRITLDDYRDFQLGYAVTTHKAQGMTTQNTYVLLDRNMQDLHLSYVQASRARGATSLYVDRKTAGENFSRIAKAMSESHEKHLATDLLDQFQQDAETRQKEDQLQVNQKNRSRTQEMSSEQKRDYGPHR